MKTSLCRPGSTDRERTSMRVWTLAPLPTSGKVRPLVQSFATCRTGQVTRELNRILGRNCSAFPERYIMWLTRSLSRFNFMLNRLDGFSSPRRPTCTRTTRTTSFASRVLPEGNLILIYPASNTLLAHHWPGIPFFLHIW